MRRHVDKLTIITREQEKTDALRDLYRGTRAAFLVGGGPSFSAPMAAELNRRGVWSMAINGVAGKAGYRPSAFVCCDPPSKFHHGLWLDPLIQKFVPTIKFSNRRQRNRLREKIGDEFVTLQRCEKPIKTNDVPNIWGFERRSWFQPDGTFFTEPSAGWGNNNAGVNRTKQPKTMCTMLAALRLVYYLGFRRVYLLGTDFWMDPGKDLAANYSFGELRDADAIANNNAQFTVVNKWLCQMAEAGVFKKYGYEIYNCVGVSGLRAFPHIPFEAALADALAGFPEEPYDLADWYLK